MSYSRLMASLHKHPKTGRLARALGVSRPQAVGHLALLWSWTQTMAPDGFLGSFEAEDIEEAVEWTGDRGAFVRAAIATRWLDETEYGLQIHDWLEYAEGWKEAERTRQRRAAKRTASATCPRHAPDSYTTDPGHAPDASADCRGDRTNDLIERSDRAIETPENPATPGNPEAEVLIPRRQLDAPPVTPGHAGFCACSLCRKRRESGRLTIKPRSAPLVRRARAGFRFAYRRQLLLPLALNRERETQLSFTLLSVLDGGQQDARDRSAGG